MPHAYAEIICSCGQSEKYHCHSHDKDGYLNDFNCGYFNVAVFKKAQIGILMGFDQLAGLYFNISCKKCGRKEHMLYEAKTFGKKEKKDFFLCCGNSLNFKFSWAH